MTYQTRFYLPSSTLDRVMIVADYDFRADRQVLCVRSAADGRSTMQRSRRRAYRLDDRPFLAAKVKRYLRMLRRAECEESFDERWPETPGHRLPAMHRALRRRRARNRVARASRKRNRRP